MVTHGVPLPGVVANLNFRNEAQNGLGFIYYHLNSIDDVDKAMTMGSHKLLQHLGIYFMRVFFFGAGFV